MRGITDERSISPLAYADVSSFRVVVTWYLLLTRAVCRRDALMTRKEAMRQTHQENVLLANILRPGDVPDGADVSAYYNRGICVY